MNVPFDAINCRDVNSSDINHKDHIDLYVREILEAVSDSGHDTIPTSKSNQSRNNTKKKKTAGWKEFVEPYQDKAKQEHISLPNQKM